MRIAVVGSGPAAAGAVMALLARGLKPEVIDIGERLDPERQQVVDALRGMPKQSWPAAMVATIAASGADAAGIPRKLAFGSDFIYAAKRSYTSVEADDVEALPTHAAGGYSMIWGSSVLPMHQDDMSAWPIEGNALDEHYRAIARSLPICGARDALEDVFPALNERISSLPLPSSARIVLDRIRARGREFGALHRLGRARLAVHTSGPGACNGCGLCLTGCPLGSIYSTLPQFDTLEREGRISRKQGCAVLSVDESEDEAQLELLRIKENRIERLSYDAVFLAAGAINSTRILLNSRRLFGVHARLRSCQKVLIPALLLARSVPLRREDVPSLPALFIELKIPRRSRHWFHVQVSCVSDLLLRRFGLDPYGSATWHELPLRWLLARLIMLWCGFHSDHSPSISLAIEPAQGALPPVRLSHLRNPATGSYVQDVRRSLSRLLRPVGLHIIPGATTIAPPGRGIHIGGTFPMRSRVRAELETDILGRPYGWRRVHLVDAACLPSLAGTTLTLTIMANAHRIATAAEVRGPS
jgi:choline dehydrogenase-like flavoprotein